MNTYNYTQHQHAVTYTQKCFENNIFDFNTCVRSYSKWKIHL